MNTMPGGPPPVARIPVLVYHRLAVNFDVASLEVPTVRVRDFERQMAYLVAAGFSTISLGELVDAHAVPRDSGIAITFDDGWSSTLDYALPVMQRHGMTATLFATTDSNASNFAPWRGLDPPLGPDGWRALAGAGWEIGSHTCTHPPLVECSDDMLMEELGSSRREIEGVIGSRVDFLAAPFGLSDRRVERAARRAGYRGMCPGGAGLCVRGQSAFRLRRIGAPTEGDPEALRRLLTSRAANIARLSWATKIIVRRAIGHRNSTRMRTLIRRMRLSLVGRS